MTTITVKPRQLTKALLATVTDARIRGVKTQEKIIHGTATRLFGGIVEGTPVGDFDPEHEGTARGSWVFKIGSPDGGFGRRNKTKDVSNLRIPRVGLVGKKLFLVSANPYMRILEFGGYPDPVKRGTFNKRTGQFEIRSAGGFSKQAPAGMIRVNVAQLGRFVRAAAAEVA